MSVKLYTLRPIFTFSSVTFWGDPSQQAMVSGVIFHPLSLVIITFPTCQHRLDTLAA